MISTFGILVLAQRQHTHNDLWNKLEVFLRIRATVNSLALEQDSANTASESSAVCNKDIIQMEIYTKTLQKRLDEQNKHVEVL